MPISATMVWEIRPANGTTNAGGGFNALGSSPGTDYSQQNGVQVAVDNVTITATTAGANSNVMTLVGHTVTAADNRNVFCATAGTNINAGLYEITAINAGANTWTVSGATNLTTAGGAGAAIVGNMGGARRGLDANGGAPTTALRTAFVAGNMWWCKRETWAEAATLSVSGATNGAIIGRGYDSSRGDNPTTVGTRPVNSGSGAGDVFTVSGQHNILMYMEATTGADAGFSAGNSSQAYQFCASYSNTNEGWEGSGSAPELLGCESYSNGTGKTDGGNVTGCYIHDNTGVGIDYVNQAIVLNFNIIEANGGHNLAGTTGGVQMMNTVLDGATGASSDGWNNTNGRTTSYAINCIFSNNGRRGITTSDSNMLYSDWNAYYNNTTAAISPASGVNGAPNQPGTHDQVGVDPQFVNRAAGNFAIGTNLEADGWPGVFPGGLSQGYMDIGAVQRQNSGGSGGGIRLAGHGGLAA